MRRHTRTPPFTLMKHTPFRLLFALALGAGLMPAAAQDAKPMRNPIPSLSPPRLGEFPLPPRSEAEPGGTLLGANYRIVISATTNGQKSGEISVQTCSAAFQISGCLTTPTADDPNGSDLSLRGEISELEGGSLRLGYSLTVTNRVPSQTLGMPGSGQAVASTYTHKKNGATGMLLLQPGRSCDLMQISGVAYSLSITPTETWPAAKPQPRAKPAAPADAPKQTDAATGGKKPLGSTPGGPSDEDRKRYENLSASAREKFRDAMRELFSQQEFRNSPEEQRRARIRQLFDQAEAEDQARNK